MKISSRKMNVVGVLFVIAAGAVCGSTQGHPPESKNMRLVGMHDLQGRSAYQPVIHRQGDRWIAYVGTQRGRGVAVHNPLTGVNEGSGTFIIDVTDPTRPATLFHIPGDRTNPTKVSNAQMVRVCDRGGERYLLRSAGDTRHEVWNVTNPTAPRFVVTVADGLKSIHKSWWECDSGIAYIVAEDPAWRTRGTKIFDLSNPSAPVFIRDFGLVGQEPGSQVEPVPAAIHGPISYRNRVYFAYGTGKNGVLQIVDREKLLKGEATPTPKNLLYPEVGRLDMPSFWGGHTSFPVLGIEVPDFQSERHGRVRDFVVLPSEINSDGVDCQSQDSRDMVFLIDITDETKPFPVANFQVPESAGNFCQRGGRFGPHAISESFTPIYYKRIVFVSYFNAGVRAMDIRDPFHPAEVAFYIPATTKNTEQRCVKIGEQERCKVVIQTENVEVDDRGFIYMVDDTSTGMHILELTGAARSIANFP